MRDTRFPSGDAFIIDTPHIDQLANRVYAEEQQEKLYRRQQNKVLDDEFSRNLSGIRDADIGDLTKAYGDFKLAHIALQKKRHEGTPQDQLDLLRKKASVYDVINKSKQDKQWEDEQAKQIMTDKKGYYADDAHQQLIQRRNTPLSKLNKEQDANLLYKYYDPNLTKQLKEAQGTDAEVSIKTGVNKTDALKDDKEIYKAGNAPDKFANKLLEGVMSSNNGRNFTGIMTHKYSDEEVEDLKNRYTAKVNDPKFISVYGEPKPLPVTDTDLGKAVAIRTMEEFANKEIKPYKMVSELNADRAMKERQKYATGKMYAQHKLTQDNIRFAAGLRKDAKDAEHDEDVNNADSVLSDVYDKISRAEKESETLSKVGRMSMGYDEKLPLKIADANLLKTFAGIKKDDKTPIPPDEVTFDKAKDQFNLVYKYAKGDEVIPISAREYVKLKVKETYPNKDIGFINNLVDKTITKHGSLYKAIQMYNPENKQAEVAPPSKNYSIKGKPYTHDSLKKLGYSDEQIEQAIKLGNIQSK